MPSGIPKTTPKRDTKFKPGQCGNPLGGKTHDPEMKALKKLTKQEMIEVGNIVVKGDVSALQAIAKNPKSSALQVMIASVAAKIISKGDMNALDTLLNRLIGKVRDEILHSGEINPPQIIITLPDNGRMPKK